MRVDLVGTQAARMSIRCIKGVAILGTEGRRICAKYFDPKLAKDFEQRTFEEKVFAKTKNMEASASAEVIMLDKSILVFSTFADVFFCVIGTEEGNELIYGALLEGFCDVSWPAVFLNHCSLSSEV